MRIAKNKKFSPIALAAFMALSSLLSVAYVRQAHAATLAQVFVRFDFCFTNEAGRDRARYYKRNPKDKTARQIQWI